MDLCLLPLPATSEKQSFLEQWHFVNVAVIFIMPVTQLGPQWSSEGPAGLGTIQAGGAGQQARRAGPGVPEMVSPSASPGSAGTQHTKAHISLKSDNPRGKCREGRGEGPWKPRQMHPCPVGGQHPLRLQVPLPSELTGVTLHREVTGVSPQPPRKPVAWAWDSASRTQVGTKWCRIRPDGAPQAAGPVTPPSCTGSPAAALPHLPNIHAKPNENMLCPHHSHQRHVTPEQE